MSSIAKKDFLTNQTYELYEAATMPFKNQTISHFALADSLMTHIGKQQQPAALHFWPTQNLMILGMMDTKLPYFSTGIKVIQSYGQDYIVRNSGGLAVVGDAGVLNFSLVFPEEPADRISIDEGYDYMFRLIKEVFKEYDQTIEAYEIPDSYCPGDFDLSIDGKKFAGIAQRRLKNGVAVMIYLSVNGDQKRRARMLQEFYTAGLQGETVKWHFPSIDPTVMASLEELLGAPFTVAEVQEKIIRTLQDRHCQVVPGTYTPDILTVYEESKEKMIRRNLQMLKDDAEKELLT